MTIQRLLVGLTVLNLGLLVFLLLSRVEPALASAENAVLRGSALEMVDETFSRPAESIPKPWYFD